MNQDNVNRLKELGEKIQNYVAHPWLMYHPAFHVVGDIYFVGNSYVSCFLLDTEKGLVLIDAAFNESAYLLFDGIRSLGFNPANIRFLLLSHGHCDHCGGARKIQEFSGCEIHLGKGDHFFFSERPDLIQLEDRVPRFPIHHSYDYDQTLDLGNVKVRPILTPGHTPGTTTLFVETIHHGKPVVCAMHGGIGINGLTEDELTASRLPLSLQQDFLHSLEFLKTQHVDVVLASHAHQYNMLERAKQDDGSGDVFFDTEGGWEKMLDRHIAMINTIIGQNRIGHSSS